MQAQVTIHTTPLRSLCSPPLPGSRDQGTISLGEHTSYFKLLQCHASLCHRRLNPHSMPLPPPGLSEKEPLISCSFNPILSEGEQTPSGDLHTETGPNPKLNPRSWANTEKKRKSLPVASGAADEITTINLMNPALVEYLNRQQIIPN